MKHWLWIPVMLLTTANAVALEDRFVPEGVWLTELSRTRELQDQAVSDAYRAGGLRDYLVPGAEQRAGLTGTVEREIGTTRLRLHWGVAPDWNLTLVLDQVTVRQSSSLRSSGGNPAAEAAVDRLGDRRLSGMGDSRLGVMQRTVFTDRHGFRWGVALRHPPGRQESDYVGRPTLATRSAHQDVETFLHYTYYPPSLPRARFDFRPELIVGRSAAVTVPDGSEETLSPGNGVRLLFSWQQEFVPVTLTFDLWHQNRTADTLGGRNEDNPTRAEHFRLSLGWGNLAELETTPLRLPYRVDLSVDRVLFAYNAPAGVTAGLSLRLYY